MKTKTITPQESRAIKTETIIAHENKAVIAILTIVSFLAFAINQFL